MPSKLSPGEYTTRRIPARIVTEDTAKANLLSGRSSKNVMLYRVVITICSEICTGTKVSRSKQSTPIAVDCFDLLTFVPVQISEQIVITTLYSMTFFDERPESKLAFAVSSVTILAGILLVVYSPGESLEG